MTQPNHNPLDWGPEYDQLMNIGGEWVHIPHPANDHAQREATTFGRLFPGMVESDFFSDDPVRMPEAEPQVVNLDAWDASIEAKDGEGDWPVNGLEGEK